MIWAILYLATGLLISAHEQWFAKRRRQPRMEPGEYESMGWFFWPIAWPLILLATILFTDKDAE